MEALRPLLVTYAYNIIGTYEDAKDIVQDAFVKFMDTDHEGIENKKAYLIRIVINSAINFKNRQKKMIAQYPGQWLPEPIDTEHSHVMMERKEVLSYSVMVLLEKLNARQRAVFVLKELFDYDHEDIADLLSISVENSRKLLSRAKTQLQVTGPPTKQNVSVDYVNKFLHILQTGDTLQLEQLLVDDITVTSDGGGKAAAFTNIISGRTQVSNLLTGMFRKFYNKIEILTGSVNHQPAFFFYENEELVTTQTFTIKNGKITHIFFMRNPDKLKTFQKIY